MTHGYGIAILVLVMCLVGSDIRAGRFFSAVNLGLRAVRTGRQTNSRSVPDLIGTGTVQAHHYSDKE